MAGGYRCVPSWETNVTGSSASGSREKMGAQAHEAGFPYWCHFGLVLNLPKSVSAWDHHEDDEVDDSTCGHMLPITSVSVLQWCDW